VTIFARQTWYVNPLEGGTMFCSGCGNNVSAGENFCRVCGKETSPASQIASPSVSPAKPAIGPAHTSGKAIASLACGIFIFAFPLSILAVIFGHLSLSEIRKSAGRLTGEGIAMAGLVLGYMGLAVIPFILIIAAIAIPNLLRARMAANESSAAGGVRTILVAEIAYTSAHPQAGYTCKLSDLESAGLNDARLLSGQRSGYTFELLGCGADVEGGPNSKFRVLAYPVNPQTTGTRVFCSDESGILKMDASGSPPDCLEKGSALQ
jgi:type IV pilus assembly protein PilA